MDERSVKRLLVMVGLSIVIILLLKMVLLKTATKLSAAKANKAAAEKTQAPSGEPGTIRRLPPVTLPDSSPATAASGVN